MFSESFLEVEYLKDIEGYYITGNSVLINLAEELLLIEDTTFGMPRRKPIVQFIMNIISVRFILRFMELVTCRSFMRMITVRYTKQSVCFLLLLIRNFVTMSLSIHGISIYQRLTVFGS